MGIHTKIPVSLGGRGYTSARTTPKRRPTAPPLYLLKKKETHGDYKKIHTAGGCGGV